MHSEHADGYVVTLRRWADDHVLMLRRWIWRDFANILLGFWLLTTIVVLGRTEPAIFWSDTVSAIIIVAFGVLALFPRFDLARWVVCSTGIWLLFAPLVFWTRNAGAYANDTLVGTLVIAFSVLLPMMPGRTHYEITKLPGPDTPPGWSYNPSDWIQRGPIIGMAFVGFFISRYLAAYQLGHIPYPWDPFFGDGTRRVLESDVSKAFPISDAGLGAVSYMIEALTGFMGGTNRWRTMPWLVLLFGFLVVPVGVVSIVLVILQPVAVGAWCTLCLVTAVTMLLMISPAFDEIIATSQFLIAAKREGKSLWRMFWIGGTLDSYRAIEASEAEAAYDRQHQSLASRIIGAFDLDNVPFNLVLAALCGAWIMFAPAVLGSTGPAANSDHVAGALAVTWAVIAFGEIARPARLLNIPIGLWLMASPWVLAGHTDMSRWNDVIMGVALVLLSIRRGRIVSKFDGWNRFLV